MAILVLIYVRIRRRLSYQPLLTQIVYVHTFTYIILVNRIAVAVLCTFFDCSSIYVCACYHEYYSVWYSRKINPSLAHSPSPFLSPSLLSSLSLSLPPSPPSTPPISHSLYRCNQHRNCCWMYVYRLLGGCSILATETLFIEI